MTYKETITQVMRFLAQHEKRVFIGYNVRIGKAGGTLEGIPDEQLIETPVAENLMVGMAIGMSLNGYLPVVYFERFDFIMNAMDAVVNHLDKIMLLSDGEFKPGVIIRCVVGNKTKPLYTGSTHTQDFSLMFSHFNIPVYNCYTVEEITRAYSTAVKDQSLLPDASDKSRSSIIVEYKDLY